jgi:hypothetical protein
MSKIDDIQKVFDESKANVFLKILRPRSYDKIDIATKEDIQNIGGLEAYFYNLHKKHKVSSVDVEFRKPNGTSSIPFGKRIELHFSEKNDKMPEQQRNQTLNPFEASGLNGLAMYVDMLKTQANDYKSKNERFESEKESIKDELLKLERSHNKLEIQHENLKSEADRLKAENDNLKREIDNKPKPWIDKETVNHIGSIVKPIALEIMKPKGLNGPNAPYSENLTPEQQNIINLTKHPKMAQVVPLINFIFNEYANGNVEFADKIYEVIQNEEKNDSSDYNKITEQA